MDPLVERAAQENIHVFLEAYGITNDQGDRLDFKDHGYLWDIFEDLSPRQAILKAAQIGFSTMANIKALWIAKNKGLDIIYSLPAASDIKEFVSGKTNRLIANNPVFQAWTADKDSIEQKRVGDSVIYYRGTWTERAAIAIPADLYISDETDRSKQDVVTQYQTRLQHSKWGWEWYFSNPSAPGNGVDKHWQVSDQHHWMVKCDCGREWYLTMDNILRDPAGKAYYGCTKCGKELDRRKGRWVARFKDKDVRGYWISSLMVPTLPAQWVLDKKAEYSEEQFANFVLGQPYVGRGNVLTRPMFLQNLTSTPNPQDSRPVIGVDTGVGINYVVGNANGLFFYDKCEDYAPLEALMTRWPNAIMVIDAGGDLIGPKKLQERFPGRVFKCYFRTDRKDDTMVSWKDADWSVQADRNRMLQLVVDEFSERRIPVFGSEADWYDYWLEWSGMFRTSEETPLGPRFVWNKPSTGRCDFPFATVYWRIGMSRFLEDRAQFVTPGAESFAAAGYEAKPDGTMFMPRPV